MFRFARFFLATAFVALACFPQLGHAANFSVRPCDDNSPTELDFMVDKKEFAEGVIRVFLVDTYGEPVCCSQHIIVYVPDQEGPGAACFHVSAAVGGDDGPMGFGGVDFDKMQASYDAKAGLTLSVPVGSYDEQSGGTRPAGTISFVVNQANSTVKKK